MTRAGDIRKIHGSRQALATRAGRGNRRGSGLSPVQNTAANAERRSEAPARDGIVRKKAIRANHAWFQQGESLAAAQTALGRILPDAISEETTHRETTSRRLRDDHAPLSTDCGTRRHPFRSPSGFRDRHARRALPRLRAIGPRRTAVGIEPASQHLFRIAERFGANRARKPPAKAPSYRAPKRLQSASFAPFSTESSRGASVGAATPDRAALRSSARASRWSATSGFFARSGPCR